MPKHSLTFQRTLTETVTVDMDTPGMSVPILEDWANLGVSGASPFDLMPEQFRQWHKQRSDWKLVHADPPLAPPREAVMFDQVGRAEDHIPVAGAGGKQRRIGGKRKAR
jgi:hypothetical protein